MLLFYRIAWLALQLAKQKSKVREDSLVLQIFEFQTNL